MLFFTSASLQFPERTRLIYNASSLHKHIAVWPQLKCKFLHLESSFIDSTCSCWLEEGKYIQLHQEYIESHTPTKGQSNTSISNNSHISFDKSTSSLEAHCGGNLPYGYRGVAYPHVRVRSVGRGECAEHPPRLARGPLSY